MKKIIFTSILLLSSIVLFGQNIDYNLKKGYLANRYDVVSYFSNAPQKGNDKFEHTYKNIKLLFASQSNLETFKANPEKYLPKYGGWCAYAIGKNGKKVSINPNTYEIRDGGLYLFYNAWGTNTLDLWNEENPTALQTQADANWIQVKFKK